MNTISADMGGYRCGSCGAWVPNACGHSCPEVIAYDPPPGAADKGLADLRDGVAKLLAENTKLHARVAELVAEAERLRRQVEFKDRALDGYHRSLTDAEHRAERVESALRAATNAYRLDEYGQPVCPSCGTATNRAGRFGGVAVNKFTCWQCGHMCGHPKEVMIEWMQRQEARAEKMESALRHVYYQRTSLGIKVHEILGPEKEREIWELLEKRQEGC